MWNCDVKGLLDPKMDFVFKQVFGTEKNKPLLISFLNALLFDAKPYIKDLRLDNTDISKILEEDKASRLDVKATTDDGTKIDIEIQIRNTGDIPQRAFHYLSNMMSHSVRKGSSYGSSNVIGIWILGENVTTRQNAISEAYMTFQHNDPDPYQILTDNARIFFIELPKFNPKKEDSKKILNAWLSFLKNPVFMDESFLQVEEFKTAMDTLKYISADDEIRAIADLRQKDINDRNSEITVAEQKGKIEGEAKGKAEGLAEGEAKKARETAINSLKIGLSIEQISQITGLTVGEIEGLKR